MNIFNVVNRQQFDLSAIKQAGPAAFDSHDFHAMLICSYDNCPNYSI
jgi:hypothetical protein